MRVRLRWINNTDHTGLTMANLTAVEPDGAGIVDGYREDGGLLN
jgi:hypothetical protein